jgi:hypothetical protein
VLSLEVQLTPPMSSRTRPSNVNLRSMCIEPLRAEVVSVRRYRDRETAAEQPGRLAGENRRGLTSSGLLGTRNTRNDMRLAGKDYALYRRGCIEI